AQELGQRGEEIACQYLEKKGYKILVRGFRYRRVEIDLIARQGSSLVFIEVKTRRHNDFGYPEEAVNNLKMRNLKAAASAFLNQSKEKFKECRFDILSITYRTQKDYQIDHFEDAF
ncbi:MAG: YraN family protein, partial [Candidatus Aminicenantes bacterium]|nr:YraN family protein [Candidatus Aminicenantes bacterium]